VIAGHFGAAAAVKAYQPRVPLWALMLATVWLDVLFVPLFAAGVETLDDSPGGGYGGSLIHAEHTHSLLGALLLSGLFGLVAARFWGRRAGIVLAATAFSHWVLDLLVHRPDLPLLPGNAGDLPLLGIGLWKVPAAVITLEFLLVIGGGLLYLSAARAVRELADHDDAITVAQGGVASARASWSGQPTTLAALLIGFGVLTLVLDVFGL
jgi:hypothetical protein